MAWLYLAIAIAGEVAGTTALKASNGLTHLGYSGLSFASYGFAFYFLAIVLKTVPVGIAYGIWSGAGVALVTLIGVFGFGQKLDFYAYLGIGLIVCGVLVLNIVSNASPH
ncbi:DMT family transporter [Hoeflea sp.]|uniref:DMT family transporter n=1 Tax=Hoeflea sp. TaxID=1940281 RepID=UPI003BB02D04